MTSATESYTPRSEHLERTGVRVGHAQTTNGRSGCTVLLCPPATVASCDVRGGAPGTREIALLAPEKTVAEAHAVLLTGGSAYGLAAADGVMQFLESAGVGFPTPAGPVPIVPAAVIYDLTVGDGLRPTAETGAAACRTATTEIREGAVGAGTGARVGKWAGIERSDTGGIGFASAELGELVLWAVCVVNALGDVVTETGETLSGARDDSGFLVPGGDELRIATAALGGGEHTIIGALATNARLSKAACRQLASQAHDGIARSVRPAHTPYDGDTLFTLATGRYEPDDAALAALSALAAELVATAIRRGVAAGLPENPDPRPRPDGEPGAGPTAGS